MENKREFGNIIVIGCDGVGKTTLCKKLSEMTGMNYHKCSIKEDNKEQLIVDLLRESENTIFDRFYYPDEQIYAKVLRGEDLDMSRYESLMDDVLIVYLYDDVDVLRARVRSRGDDYISEYDIINILIEYDKWLESTNLKVIKVKGCFEWNF